jgi:hypothetical protein
MDEARCCVWALIPASTLERPACRPIAMTVHLKAAPNVSAVDAMAP